MFFYFKEHPLFAEKFTDWLILDFLDEIIPDTLIETLTTTDNLVCTTEFNLFSFQMINPHKSTQALTKS